MGGFKMRARAGGGVVMAGDAEPRPDLRKLRQIYASSANTRFPMSRARWPFGVASGPFGMM
jgi:hypothetical protein